MSFFKELKEDLSQAVNELIPDDDNGSSVSNTSFEEVEFNPTADAGGVEASIFSGIDDFAVEQEARNLSEEELDLKKAMDILAKEMETMDIPSEIEAGDEISAAEITDLGNSDFFNVDTILMPEEESIQEVALEEEITLPAEDAAEESILEAPLEEEITLPAEDAAEESILEAPLEEEITLSDEDAVEESILEAPLEEEIILPTEEAANTIEAAAETELSVEAVEEDILEAPLEEEIILPAEEAANTIETAAETELSVDTVVENTQGVSLEKEISVQTVAAAETMEIAEEIAEAVTEIHNDSTAEEISNSDTIKEEIDMNAFDNFENEAAVDENGCITGGMNIKGDILSLGNLEVLGTVNGNIEIKGKLDVSGTIVGNSKAAEIYADGAKITGEIVSLGSVKVGQDSVIIGNINATSAVIAGAVKGDIDVHGPVILDTSAIVMGDIKSKSVQINNGAVIEGRCSQCYADVSPTSFFNDLK